MRVNFTEKFGADSYKTQRPRLLDEDFFMNFGMQ